MLSLRQLRQFLAVADAMSFRRAAERLHMAQPPLTAAIRQMEEALGVCLFERTNRIVRLTPAGEILRDEATRTLAQAERAVLLTRRAAAGEIGQLRIGFVASAVSGLMPSLIRSFRVRYPDVHLELTEAPTARQAAALIDRRLDVGIIVLPLPAGLDRRIATRVLRRGSLVAALPAGHSLAAAAVPLRALSTASWILFPAQDGPGLYNAIMAACTQAGFVPRVAQQAVQMETIIGLVAARLGIALVPDHYRETDRSGVVFRPIEGAGTPVPYDVALAWRADDQSPVLHALLACVAPNFPSQGGERRT